MKIYKPVKDYTNAISHLDPPRAEYYLELDVALTGFDRALEQLGLIVTIQLYWIEREMKMQRYYNAIKRVDQIAAKSPRKEKWLLRPDEILIQAGCYEETHTTLVNALTVIKTLRQHSRKTKTVTRIEAKIVAALDNLPVPQSGR